MGKEFFKPAAGYLLCRVAPPRKLSNTPLVLPQQMGGKSKGGDAGNEVTVVIVGPPRTNEFGWRPDHVCQHLPVQVGDRIAIGAVKAPVTVDGEQLLLIDAEDVLGVINNWEHESKVQT